jgi:hypothetical protein
VVHTAIYDAWAAYDPVAVGTRMGSNLRQQAADRTLDNKNRAVSFAAYAALVDLFPARQAVYAKQMVDLGYVTNGSDTSSAAMVGATAAQAVLDWRHHDGANQLADEPGTPIPLDGSEPKPYSDYTGHKPKNSWNTPADTLDPDHWQPLCADRHRYRQRHAAHASRQQLRWAELQGPDVPDPVLDQGHPVRPHLGVAAPPTGRLHLSGAGRQAERQVHG